jgi:hypothetical protein
MSSSKRKIINKQKGSSDRKQEIRDLAEDDLLAFIRLIAPYRVIGHVHEDLCKWWTRSTASNHQLTLLPRDHGKSAYIAYRCVWEIVRRPDIRILYVSSTSGLAEKQLKSIKDILTSKIFQYYWPEYVNTEEGKREKWTNSEIAIDHPKRKSEGIRDATVFTGGLTTSLTGFHCDIAVLDDVVVQENAYTSDGRKKVEEQYSLLASIEGTDAKEWVVGTRYHPKDLYNTLIQMNEDVFDEDGEVVEQRPVYELFERQVEDKGDGTGQFLWPRTARSDGKWFGFNKEILAKKRAQYIDKTQFRAQYYNDPNDLGSGLIQRERFQYYEPKHLSFNNGHLFFRDRRLNVYAAVDFAYSTKIRSDYTSIVVIGIDHQSNIYVLDVDRFKTSKISEYFSHIVQLQSKWGFRKLRAEVSAAQEVIVKELKEQYMKPQGIVLAIDEHRPNRTQGSKEDRMAAILEPRYTNMSVWHYRGGNCEVLEEELILQNPPHDDVKDALSAVIGIAVPPTFQGFSSTKRNNIVYNSRFGGMGG